MIVFTAEGTEGSAIAGAIEFPELEEMIKLTISCNTMTLPKRFASTPSQLRWLRQSPPPGSNQKWDYHRLLGPTDIPDDKLQKAWILANAYSKKGDPKAWAPTLNTFGQRFRWGLYTSLVKWGIL